MFTKFYDHWTDIFIVLVLISICTIAVIVTALGFSYYHIIVILVDIYCNLMLHL